MMSNGVGSGGKAVVISLAAFWLPIGMIIQNWQNAAHFSPPQIVLAWIVYIAAVVIAGSLTAWAIITRR